MPTNKKFLKELKKQLKTFMTPYKLSYKIKEDEKGIVLGIGLSTTPSSDFDLNLLYRVDADDIVQKDITQYFKVVKILREIKLQFKIKALEKYLKEGDGKNEA